MELKMKPRIKSELIKNYMKVNNLSKTAFCKQCKISTNTYNKVINGEPPYYISGLFKIAKNINKELFEMFDENNNNFSKKSRKSPK